jgi:hypothetical protein
MTISVSNSREGVAPSLGLAKHRQKTYVHCARERRSIGQTSKELLDGRTYARRRRLCYTNIRQLNNVENAERVANPAGRIHSTTNALES